MEKITLPTSLLRRKEKIQKGLKGFFKSITFTDKLKLTNNLKSLSEVQLGKIVKFLETSCPVSLKAEDDKHLQIFIDKIDKDNFKELEKYF